MLDKNIILKELLILKDTFLQIIDIHGEKINEETIKNSIVTELLKMLGYKTKWFFYEYPTYGGKKRVDISLKCSKSAKSFLFIEVKKPTKKLNNKDYEQICTYTSLNGIEWGMLTNGKEYILFNSFINDDIFHKEVLRFSLLDIDVKRRKASYDNNIATLKFFSYDCLIKSKNTNYFIYLAKFKKSFDKIHSYKQYESTIFSYLNYLSDTVPQFELCNIRPNTFKEFLIETIPTSSWNNKKTKSMATIINKFSHINSFYSKVIEPIEKQNPFKNLTQSQFLNEISSYYDLKEKESVDIPLVTIEELKMLLEHLKSNRHSLRNKVILLLCIYAGLDKNELSNINLKDVNDRISMLKVGKRILPIPISLRGIITEYINERKSIKTNCPYLFCSGKYSGKHDKISDSSMDIILNTQFNSLNIPEERKKVLNSSSIKKSLIINLHLSDVPLQEIAKFTGLSLSSLEEYITKEDIEGVKLKKVLENHPYNEIFKKL
ncbi:type I restriction enzyme HsdR N-terminal domain-containing protein [Clostridium thailandense]|uniref:type I restriction enzyme HsdR N-terminal domain-containing protein n=1 Tax=Clostridium thailandense TaxID=2794346 RepID=UPI003989B200